MVSTPVPKHPRPLSPHLQIWRWGPGMVLSILHRATGLALSLVGLPLFIWWLAALAAGPDAYATYQGWVWPEWGSLGWSGLAIIGSLVRIMLRIAVIGMSWSFFSHAASGIRHLVLDTGAGYELGANKLYAILTPIIGILLTVLFWAVLLLR